MPAPRIFVSSTCYDLSVVRSELRSFLNEFGYTPHLSDYSDILYDPRQHTHTACLNEIPTCDMLIVIIGPRFGGKTVPQALNLLDFSALQDESLSVETLKTPENLSITQAEVLKGIYHQVPIFAFVDSGVMNDHLTYEKNKEKDILPHISFPNIEKQETAKYIFEFINFIRHRATNNAVTPFSRLDDIRDHLKKQWAALFQRLLYEQRFKKEEARRMDYFAGQIADIKAALITTLSSTQLKDIAKGTINYRGLIDFISSAFRGTDDLRELLRKEISWNELLELLHIQTIEEGQRRSMFGRAILILEDGTYFGCRMPAEFVHGLSVKWEQFRKLEINAKNAVIDALLEYQELRGVSLLRYFPEQYADIASGDSTSQAPADEAGK